MTAHRLCGRSEADRIKDDAKHRETLRSIMAPVKPADVADTAGLSAESWRMRVRKLTVGGLAQKLETGHWVITEAGRNALASDALISISTPRKDTEDTWALLLGARPPSRVTGRRQGKMQMSARI